MILSRTTPCQVLSILEPKYKGSKVLLACYKVGTHNKIIFTKAKSMPGEYYVSGAIARSYPKVSNGSIMCFEVPLHEIEPLELV